MKNRTLLLVLSMAAAAAGCTGFEHTSSPSSPTAAGNNSLLGSWTSSSIIPPATACTDFVWNITEQTATTARGSFSATCPGDLHFTGTAEGGFTSASAIAWSAQGNATGPGLTSCAITLTGTATLGTDSISVPYSGNTCLGPVTGTQTLKKH